MTFTYFDPDEIGAEDDGDDEVEEEAALLTEKSSHIESVLEPRPVDASNDVASSCHRQQTICQVCRRYCDEFVRDNVMVCLGIFFLTLFMQTNSETVLPPLMQSFFHSGTFENSLFFGAFGFIMCAFWDSKVWTTESLLSLVSSA